MMASDLSFTTAISTNLTGEPHGENKYTVSSASPAGSCAVRVSFRLQSTKPGHRGSECPWDLAAYTPHAHRKPIRILLLLRHNKRLLYRELFLSYSA